MTALLVGRRSAACGERCGRRPCTGYEVHAAALLAGEPGQAWRRLWVRALVLAFLTGRPVPKVPGPLRSAGPLRAGGQALSPRGHECLLATVIDAAIAARAPAMRTSYDPRYLTAVTATVAGRMLGDSAGAPARGGGLAPAGAPTRAGVPPAPGPSGSSRSCAGCTPPGCWGRPGPAASRAGWKSCCPGRAGSSGR